MRQLKLITILLALICFAQSITAQNNRKIQYRADIGLYDEELLPGAQRLIGHVAFAQDNIRGYCDSAYLYERDNYLIAFGDRVKILVGDSVVLYGRKAYYDGNIKTASIAHNVRLENQSSYLLTDSLIYNLDLDMGYYLTGGRIFNGEDTLTSQIGRYYTNTDDAYLSQNVLLMSKTYRMDCDSLRYNTGSKIAFFISPTHLFSDEDSSEIFTNAGWYDTERERSMLTGNVQLFNHAQKLFADSVRYSKGLSFGQAWNNVTIIDTAQNFILKGNYAQHHEHGGISFATDSALLILIDDNKDSLFLHADTLKVLFDSNQSAQWMSAYDKVKFYRKDLQGACDSLMYIVEDSLITMFYNPVVWSEEYQLSADTIHFTILDTTNMRLDLCKSGFIVGGIYENTEFNQIKGINITGYIRDKSLYQVDIINNAECVYYLQEEDSSLIGINTSITNEMSILLEDNKISQIRFFDQPDGKIYPDKQFDEKNRKLQDFRWLDEYRPYRIADLFVKPIPRYKAEEP